MIRKMVVLLAAVSALASCGGGGTTTNTSTTLENSQVATSTATVKGKILDKQGQPVAGVSITVGDKAVSSGTDGSYEVAVGTSASSVVLLAKKDGYGTNAKEIPVIAGRTLVLDLPLFADDVKATIAANIGGTVALANNATVKLEPNSLRTPDGKPYAGNVIVAASYHGPDTSEGIQAFPQPYAGMDNGQKAVLRSVGVIEVKLSDTQGKPLQLDSNLPATLTFPNSSVAEGAANIPLWYYDEAARIWMREGEATRQADGSYQGKVKHFTLWNADKPYLVAEGTMLKGCVKNAAGVPVAGAPATVKGKGLSLYGITGKDGTFETYVASGVTLYVSYFDPTHPNGIEVEVPALTAGEKRQLACQTVNLDLSTLLVYPLAALSALTPTIPVPPTPVTPTVPATPTLPPVQNYAGMYSGTYSGAENGTFNVTINNTGIVSGSVYSNTYASTFAVIGAIAAGGSISLNATGSAGSAAFSGAIDIATGKVSGTWTYSGTSTGGTFTGQKQ